MLSACGMQRRANDNLMLARDKVASSLPTSATPPVSQRRRRQLAWIGSTTLLLVAATLLFWKVSRWYTFQRQQNRGSNGYRLRGLPATAAAASGAASSHNATDKRQRLLFITTSLSEMDTGIRQTVAGYDRFAKTILPVLRESVTSLVDAGYAVDVYFIAHYNLTTTASTVPLSRYQALLAAFPDTVGVEVWEDATPIGYEMENSVDHVMLHTRGLSRQHRYVIKDKYMDYDLFVCMEDDMLIRSAQVDHYVQVTDTLYDLRLLAPPTYFPDVLTVEQGTNRFYGPMTNRQLARTMPGFMRVEAALSDFVPFKRAQRYEQIPVDFSSSTTTPVTMSNNHSKVLSSTPIELAVDPSICCHVSAHTSNENIPAAPTKNDLYFWEMSIEALGVRKMPMSNTETLMAQSVLDWVLLLGGSNNEAWEDAIYIVGDYWSGRGPQHYFGPHYQRPDRREGRYANNQGGWMATKRQIAEWHMRWCRGGLLPPFDAFKDDGLDGRSVEYWSGGIQLVGINSCNLQRIVSLDPHGFSRHLLYHTSNNKQRSKRVRRHFSGRSINDFWGQLNTVVQNADAVRLEELAAKQGGKILVP